MFKEFIGIIACPITQEELMVEDSDELDPRVNNLGVRCAVLQYMVHVLPK